MDEKKLKQLATEIIHMCESAEVSFAGVLTYMYNDNSDDKETIKSSLVETMMGVDPYAVHNTLNEICKIEMELVNTLRKHPELIPIAAIDGGGLKPLPDESTS